MEMFRSPCSKPAPIFHRATAASGSISWWAMTVFTNRSSMTRGKKTNISDCAAQDCFMTGGTTNHWGGLTPRFKPEDFELKTRTGYGVDWPIDYEDLAPYYAQAEILLGVTGDSDNDDPPRYGARYPFPATAFTLGDRVVIDALESHGISYGHMSIARSGNRCITTGTCDYCPVNARYTALFDLAQLQIEYGGKLTLRTESPVTRILMDGKNRTRGVEFLDLRTGAPGSMEAEAVIVCAGTFESCKLLLASTSEDWPRRYRQRLGSRRPAPDWTSGVFRRGCSARKPGQDCQ